jgi:glycosyltransferase involved in cell wall biosynthesis
MAARTGGLAILDDFFPTPSTGFRIAEFTWLLDQKIASHVRTTTFPFGELRTNYLERHPALAPTIYPYDADELRHFELAYMVFVNNAARFLPDLIAADLPFVLTLYPGGGLDLGTRQTRTKLDSIADSGLLRHVITTQPRVTAALDKILDPSVPVTEIDGVVVNPDYFRPGAGFRKDYFGSESTMLQLGFVAHKYSRAGADKGYPLFIELVRRLKARGLPVKAKIIGTFDRLDCPCEDLDDVLQFYGVLEGQGLRAALSDIQLVVSPNVPNLLAKGSFDGFPTGSCVEAALCGAAILATDELAQNTMFRNGRDILIEKPDLDAMEERVLGVVTRPGRLLRIAQSGLSTVRRHYSRGTQLDPRGAILSATLTEVRAESSTEQRLLAEEDAQP